MIVGCAARSGAEPSPTHAPLPTSGCVREMLAKFNREHWHDDDEVRGWFASHVVTDSELWLAVNPAGTPVGILVLDGECVDQLYVEPTMTGQGIGAQLLDLAKRRRPQGLRLWTFVSNVGAQRFYERHGFMEIDRTDGHRNEERAPDILYAWQADG